MVFELRNSGQIFVLRREIFDKSFFGEFRDISTSPFFVLWRISSTLNKHQNSTVLHHFYNVVTMLLQRSNNGLHKLKANGKMTILARLQILKSVLCLAAVESQFEYKIISA